MVGRRLRLYAGASVKCFLLTGCGPFAVFGGLVQGAFLCDWGRWPTCSAIFTRGAPFLPYFARDGRWHHPTRRRFHLHCDPSGPRAWKCGTVPRCR